MYLSLKTVIFELAMLIFLGVDVTHLLPLAKNLRKTKKNSAPV